MKNRRYLGVGALLMFSSSFGQTFFISLFSADIQNDFSLSHSGWGGVFMFATLLSAFVMASIGSVADRFQIRHIATLALGMLLLACMSMSLVTSVSGLFLACFSVCLPKGLPGKEWQLNVLC